MPIIGIILINNINFYFLRFDYIQEAGILEKINLYQELTSGGNFSVDISSLSFPLKIFTFMYRPLFIDARNLFGYIMSVENLILLGISFYPIFKIIKTLKLKKSKLDLTIIFITIFLTITWIFYSQTISNLGTANRYKLVLTPPLIYLALSFSINHNSLKNNKLQ